MDDRAGSGAGANEDDTPRRLDARVAGAAVAAGAVSLGLVLIGSCGLGQHDVYVTPPPLNADLQSAPTGLTTTSRSTTAGVHIPPSPSWRVAVDPPPRRSVSSTPATATSSDESSSPTPYAPYAVPGETTRTTGPGSYDESRTTTTRPRPTTTARRTTPDYTTTSRPSSTHSTTSPAPTPEYGLTPDYDDEYGEN